MKSFNRFIASILSLGIFFSNVMPGQLMKAAWADVGEEAPKTSEKGGSLKGQIKGAPAPDSAPAPQVDKGSSQKGGSLRSQLPQTPPDSKPGSDKGGSLRHQIENRPREDVVRHIPVTFEDCRNLYSRTEQQFCDDQSWRQLKDDSFRNMIHQCYRLSYDYYIRGNIHHIFASELARTKDKQGHEDPAKAQKAMENSFGKAQKDTQKYLNELEGRLKLLNEVQPVQDQNNAFVTPAERKTYFDYIDQVSGMGKNSDEHYDMCVDYATKGAVTSYKGGNANLADYLSQRPEPSVPAFGRQYDRLELCRKVYREGRDFYINKGDGGYEPPEQYHEKMAIYNEDLANRGGDEGRKMSKKFGDLYAANINLAEQCKNKVKAASKSNVWLWLLLAGVIGLGIYLLVKNKKKDIKDPPKKPRKPRKPPKGGDDWDCEDCSNNNNNGNGNNNNNNNGNNNNNNNNNGNNNNNNNGNGNNNNNGGNSNTAANDWANDSRNDGSGRASGSDYRETDNQTRTSTSSGTSNSTTNNSGRTLAPGVKRKIAQ
jgi:hypothetical protein